MQEHIFKRKRRVNGKVVSSHCYYGHYTLADDTTQKTVALGVTDLQVAKAKLRKIVQDAEREAAGIVAPKHLRESAQKPLTAHLDDFLADLKASGRAEMYQANVGYRLTKLFKDRGL